MLKSISWKFGAFSIVRSRFTKGHFHMFFVLCKHLNNSRTEKAMTFKFWLRLVQRMKSVSQKFGVFSIVHSRFIKGHFHMFFVLCERLNDSRTEKAMTFKF